MKEELEYKEKLIVVARLVLDYTIDQILFKCEIQTHTMLIVKKK